MKKGEADDPDLGFHDDDDFEKTLKLLDERDFCEKVIIPFSVLSFDIEHSSQLDFTLQVNEK